MKTALKLCLVFVAVFALVPASVHADPPKSSESKVAQWVYDASLTWIPLAPVSGWETKDQADARRLTIATVITAVAVATPGGPSRTAAHNRNGSGA